MEVLGIEQIVQVFDKAPGLVTESIHTEVEVLYGKLDLKRGARHLQQHRSQSLPAGEAVLVD